MNAVTLPVEPHLEEALSRFDIGQLEHYQPAANGIENSNYFVTTRSAQGQREYVLTIIEQPSNAGDAYVEMMDELAASGLPVAPPIRNIHGLPVDEVDGKPAILQTRLPGKHVYNPTNKQVCALARCAARMHQAMRSSALGLPNYPRDGLWLAETSSVAPGHIPYNDLNLLQTSVQQVHSLLRREDVEELPRGMIHGDLFRDNVLFNEHGLAGVIDFHHASNGYLIYDLAVMANDWCCDATGQMDPERTLAMLQAYHQIRPLVREELWYFSAFTLYAALTFWLSRLAVALDSTSKNLVRFKNPDEFKGIVEQHMRHPFYVDYRQFIE
jgi:homoserine kinase type II